MLAFISLCLGEDFEVTHYNPEGVFIGTTLLADMTDYNRPRVVEVDFEGNILWEYRLPENIKGTVLDASILNTGNFLITVRGQGIFEINRNKEMVWRHKDPGASHDADRLSNGNTLYNLGWTQKGDDVIREIDPNGKIIWSWNGLSEFDKEPFSSIDREGWMHANSVSRLENGNTLVSIRNFNTIAEIDKNGKAIRKWTFNSYDKHTRLKTVGKIKGSRNHEPEILQNGNMLLALRRPNRFVEFNTTTEEIVWSWEHPIGEKELRTNRDANRLPNGNTLGTAANKIIEISPKGQIVWQILTLGGTKNRRKFHKAIRIGPNGQAYGG